MGNHEEKKKLGLEPSLDGIDGVSTFIPRTPATDRNAFILRMKANGFTFADDGMGKLKVTGDWNRVEGDKEDQDDKSDDGAP